MTTPHTTAAVGETIAGILITDRTPVLHRRPLHPDADPSAVPAFGDDKWSLAAALPDRHTADQSLNWTRYPRTLRHGCKLYAFALINVLDDAPRLANARTPVPAVKTLVADLGYLHPFTTWLYQRDITSFAAVSTDDLDAYHRHVDERPGVATTWKRKALVAVQRLHAYRNLLPEQHRLPATPLWGGASAAELAAQPPARITENSTLRIHPEVMEPLLSAALLVTDTIAADLLPAATRLVAMRTLAHAASRHTTRPRLPGPDRNRYLLEHLHRVLTAYTAAGHTLPGRPTADGVVLDHAALATAGRFDRAFLRKVRAARDTITASGLPIESDLLAVTEFTRINGQPWRTEPVDTDTLLTLLRHVTTACLLVIAYLSGIRTGEALNLRRGCITRDHKLGMIFLTGQQMKATDDRRERSPATIPWVVTDHVAHAVSVLEALAPGPLLFPAGQIVSPEWDTEGTVHSRRAGKISHDIKAFTDWFTTTIAPTTGHAPIGDDPGGSITTPRLRRTLAWHIVRRPGGTIAAATQYGHLHTQVIQGYAGRADSGFLDEITFEQFLFRAETLHDDHRRALDGEHTSGPAAHLYQDRLTATQQFHGLTVTTAAQAAAAMTNPALQIHHGALLTCVYRPDTAACREPDTPAPGGPTWTRCRLTCSNAARTDRDIARLRDHVVGLERDLAATGLPEPLRHRIQQRLDQHHLAITEHETTRPHTPAEQSTRQLT